MTRAHYLLAIFPTLLPAWYLVELINDPTPVLSKWVASLGSSNGNRLPSRGGGDPSEPELVGSQLLAFLIVSILGFTATNHLVPNIRQYTLRRGISGKDLGKRGTSRSDTLIPEALGIVPGTIFLVCLIFCLVWYANHHPSKLLDVSAALLSICFMLFLGFTDDVLDWPWRYKLILPTVASLPLLCCYNGSTSIVVPIPMRSLLVAEGNITTFGRLIGVLVEIDPQANGSLIDLGFFYLIYMGLLAVFCTNAINIYAGINGLEVGQSYIIGTCVLLHNLIEIKLNSDGLENHLFSAMLMSSFVGVSMGILRHNWYPASIFVGDTFCYFAGMTFAVVGILGHFSKTLLLFFIPQIVNFLWSLPQLFRVVPCPRHRLPAFNPASGLMQPSTFKCNASEFPWLKKLNNLDADATEIPNMTLINLFLSCFGPRHEEFLCANLLMIQYLSCLFGLFVRYYVADFFF